MILNLDTSSDMLYVSVAKDGICIAEKNDSTILNQATKIHVFIEEILLENNIKIESLNAIALLNGPGSYTGLRIGLSTAKGLSYVLKIPIIAISNLEAIAYQFNLKNPTHSKIIISYFTPMVGEIIYAKYDSKMNVVEQAKHILLDEFKIQKNEILVGNDTKNVFINFEIEEKQELIFDHNLLNMLTFQYFLSGKFVENIELVPFYVKEAYINVKI